MRPTTSALAVLATVVALTLAVYLPGLSGPLLLDDLPHLDPLIRDSGDAPEELFGNYILSTSGPFGRPVAMATFIADAVTHGSDIWWWKYGEQLR